MSRCKATVFAGALVTLTTLVVLFATTAALAAGLPAPSQTPDLPPGLSAVDWASISNHIRAQQSPGLTAADANPLGALLGAPPAQQAYLKASNTGADDRFGWMVAMSGDTVVVGAHQEDSSATGVNGDQTDNSATDSGAVYVFVRSGGSWTQQAYLKASNTDAGDYFGYSVAISGDTLVVGALYEDSSATGVNGDQGDNSASNPGAAYVFTRSGSTWSQQAYLKASNTGATDVFGCSVATSGDTVVVGACGEDSNATGVNGDQSDNSATDSGAAYVFTRSGTTWTQQAYLKASNTAALDNFGFSVAISGDTVVAGALWEDSSATGVNGDQSDNGGNDSGAAYVFTRSGTTWSQQAYLKASNTQSGDSFGSSLAVSGSTVVVGAYGEDSSATGVNGNQSDNSASYSGAAYVFVRSGSTWSQQAYLKASNTDANDNFGYFVAISGDKVAVGAYGEASNATGVNGDEGDNSAYSSGAVYVFARGGSIWSQQSYLKASNTAAFDNFGFSVAISGDTLVVGAQQEDSNATGVNGDQSDNSAGDSGAAYTFVLATPVSYSSIKGSDRFDTAIRVSKAMFPAALPADYGLVLAPGETFPEALCGAPLATMLGGPVLLTPSVGLNNGVKAEILRLAPAVVICIGLSSTVVNQVATAVGPSVDVLYIRGTGGSPYDMSYRVASFMGFLYETAGNDPADLVGIVTRGNLFPDAIGVSPLACYQGWPIILTPNVSGSVGTSGINTFAELGITAALKVGTYVTLPAGVTGLANLSGTDRYVTNVNVANWAWNNTDLSFFLTAFATGDKFPDALASGPYLAWDGGILLLSPLTGPLPPPIGALITTHAEEVEHLTFIACIEPVISQVKALLP